MEQGEVDLHRWFEAARENDAALIMEFLEWGFWCEAKNPHDGMTALMAASQEGAMEAVFALLGECNVDERDEFGNTAALVAASAGKNLALDALLKAGADPRAVNQHGVSIAQALAAGAKRRAKAAPCFGLEL